MCEICRRIEKIRKGENPYFVKELETGYVVIGDSQHFYGYTLFLCKRCVCELFELDDAFRQKHLMEMTTVAHAVYNAFSPRKMNYECLGNGDSHIHWHLFPRNDGDTEKPGPVWWLEPDKMWNKSNIPTHTQLEEMKSKLVSELEKLL